VAPTQIGDAAATEGLCVVRIQCPECDRGFDLRRSNQIFCSDACRKIFSRRNIQENKQVSIISITKRDHWNQKECLICGEIHPKEVPYCPKLDE
jgi:hypothetical protein